MFSFHKPKIYRSLQGCCICRAKSSSSRFTDSTRYEMDFEMCFRTADFRSGEICNACVLLVKRWKKLPAGSNRNWQHVVDARAGPGTKSITKLKNKSKEDKKLKKKHKHKKVVRKTLQPQSPSALSDDILGDEYDRASHLSTSPFPSDGSDDDSHMSPAQRRYANLHHMGTHGRRIKRKVQRQRVSSFLDLTYWKKTNICCGIIFKGLNGEVLVDTQLLRPCGSCNSGLSSRPRSQFSSDIEDPASPGSDDTPDLDLVASLSQSSPMMDPMDVSIAGLLDLSTAATALQPLPKPSSDVLDLSLPSRKNNHGIPCIQMEV